MVNTIYLISFVETPRKFIIAELSIHKLGCSSVLIIRIINNNSTDEDPSLQIFIISTLLLDRILHYYSTDEDPSLRIESFAIINIRGVSTELIKYNINLVLWIHQN